MLQRQHISLCSMAASFAYNVYCLRPNFFVSCNEMNFEWPLNVFLLDINDYDLKFILPSFLQLIVEEHKSQVKRAFLVCFSKPVHQRCFDCVYKFLTGQCNLHMCKSHYWTKTSVYDNIRVFDNYASL